MSSRLPLLLALALSGSLLLGCTAARGTPARTTSDGWSVRQVRKGDSNKEIAWRAGSPGEGWTQDGARTADFAWAHSAMPSTIYGDSSCGRGYEDVPLTVLVNHLTFGFEQLTTDSQEELDLAGRGALRRVFSATLDGRPIKLASTVIKKGPCIFDLVYVTAAPARFGEGLAAYERVVAGLAIREGR